MIHIKRFHTFEKNTNDQIEATKKLNSPYNWDVVPDTDKKDYKHHSNVDIKEIEIGSDDPVQRFKEWCGNYWAKKKNRFKKQDEGQND